MSSSHVEMLRSVTARLLTALGILVLACISVVVVCEVIDTSVPVVLLPVAFGMVGGFISVQRRLRQLDDTELQLLGTSWPFVFLSPFAGGLLAVVLYCLFMSQMISGPLFPKFSPGSTSSGDLARLFEAHATSYTDYAKLVVWSFIAGFTETFVTDVLGVYVKHATDASKRQGIGAQQGAATDAASPRG